MRKNKLLLIVLPVAGGLIAIICIAAALLLSGQMKSDKYYEQIRSARQYLTEGDYSKVIEAYKAAIELKPENPEAYMALAQAYMENGQYDEAKETARLGFSATRDKRLEELILKLSQSQFVRDGSSGDEQTPAQDFVASGEDSEDLTLRYSLVEALSDYCYVQLVDAYGEPSVSYLSAQEGYRMKFNGMNGYAYFKNTPEHPDLINESTRIPEQNARPYKYAILSPSWIFIGFDGYISHNRLCMLLGSEAFPVYDETQGVWFTEFLWNGGRIRIETDSEGNVYKEAPVIELYPESVVKEDWEEETEPETETEEMPATFTLGSQTYAYDVVSIQISGEYIESLEPLAQCKNLQELILTNCVVDSLEPLSGCSALTMLYLRGTTGFSDLSPLSGLQNLVRLDLHSCSDVSDISPIMNMNLWLLHTCETGVSYEQTMEYKQLHPECEVWYDNHPV